MLSSAFCGTKLQALSTYISMDHGAANPCRQCRHDTARCWCQGHGAWLTGSRHAFKAVGNTLCAGLQKASLEHASTALQLVTESTSLEEPGDLECEGLRLATNACSASGDLPWPRWEAWQVSKYV